ncbi:NAD(P)-binding domain-containing protein [Nonomuraea sp. NBC_01738]|uniref:NAD(P)-binding domain-containing protein n=1 Tax=Nonomuraea sp. NBC_01738 TaxID=2976003 RepID=UPI002E0F09DE|nr:NAD(P)-binding domain-containing protein [Nonomuraea sp. NBC_01738]
MKRIGIIGVGEIARAIVTGLCHGDDTAPQISLSPRGAHTAHELATRYDTVQIRPGNQDVIHHSDIILIAVRGADRHQALAGLTVPHDKTIINVMAGVPNDDLRQTLDTKATLVRAIPLPAVRERRSVTVTYPAHPDADELFTPLGGTQPVADEAAFNVYSALTGTLTTHYAYLAALATWATTHGVDPDDADRYIRGLFQAVGRSLDDSRTLAQLAADHETPGGSNEHVRTTWFDPTNTQALTTTLDTLLTRLT